MTNKQLQELLYMVVVAGNFLNFVRIRHLILSL